MSDTERANLRIGIIAAISAVLGALLGAGASIYVADATARSEKVARAEVALRDACTTNLKIQAQARALLNRAADALTIGSMGEFEASVDAYNELGSNGEASELFLSGPDGGLHEAVTRYIESSDAALRAVTRLGATPEQFRVLDDEIAPVTDALAAMNTATQRVGIECRRQIELS